MKNRLDYSTSNVIQEYDKYYTMHICQEVIHSAKIVVNQDFSKVPDFIGSVMWAKECRLAKCKLVGLHFFLLLKNWLYISKTVLENVQRLFSNYLQPCCPHGIYKEHVDIEHMTCEQG